LKYEDRKEKIPLVKRKELNEGCLAALREDSPNLSEEDIFNMFTGVGGLHGLNYVDYSNYHDFSEAKKEIEQGQFFTSDALCKWVLDCIRPEYRHTIADLTCGKGSFFNHIQNEENIYGCEIDPDSFAVARYLYPNANLTLGDIRSYKPGIHFNIIVGNPPYNLNWEYDGKKTQSQMVYILKAAELLFPGGILAVIVPETFLGELTRKIDVKRIYEQFNHVVQIGLDPNEFSWLGVRNFPTKLLILQRKAAALESKPYNPELVTLSKSQDIYCDYLQPVMEITRTISPKIKIECNRDKSRREERGRKEKQLLYQIRIHPRTAEQYQECKDLLNKYYTQKCPEGMKYADWERIRLRYGPVMNKIRSVLKRQNNVEIDKVELVKNDDRIYYKAYSENVKALAAMRNQSMDMQRITQLVAYGTEVDFERCGPYRKLLERKQKAYRHQIIPFVELEENAEILMWLEAWELRNKWGEHPIKLNARQLHDTNLILQKNYSYLQWSQGAGKTVAGTAAGMYRLAHEQTDYVFVVSSAISIETTWAPFLELYGIPHKVIRKRADLRHILPGDFVLITLGRVKNYQRQIQFINKLVSRRLFLIYDEAQNSSALEASDKYAKLTKATLACFRSLRYKLLMSGTSINNNVIESFPQLYLLYNASVNMRCMARTLYSWSEDAQEYFEEDNDIYGEAYPAYMQGLSYFRHSHLPEKLTVFGVVQRRQDILNAVVLRELISYTMLTRTFKEVTGKDLERRTELRAAMNPAETKLYEVALKEFYRLEAEYFKSTTMTERVKAQARIIAQIKIMLRICTCATVFKDYRGPKVTGKMELIMDKIAEIPDKRVAVGVRENKIVRAYAAAMRARFPHRKVFTVTGTEYAPKQRRDLIYGRFEDYDDSILICTQQSLSESISIDSVDYCFLCELHWNDTKMSQFYFRFIRYTSTREKYIYYVNYPDSIETNLIFLLVAKERMLRFLKGQDISFEELFAEMGFELDKHQGAVFRQYTEDGPELVWGQQRIAA
jgi:SAM-dependent methyltransferase